MKIPFEKCPHCGKDYNFELVAFSESIKERSYYRVIKCKFCDKRVFLLESYNEDISYYYPQKVNLKFPLSFYEISPNGIEIYIQAIQAKISGLHHLVGCGLRKALEHIVTDYLINVQNLLPENLNIKLFKKIELLDKTLYATACANIVRLLGNDLTHYENNHEADYDELISNIENIAILMSCRYETIQAEKRLQELRIKN